MKYYVEIFYTGGIEVEADNESEALDIANEQYMESPEMLTVENYEIEPL
jgi:hypothetical protein